MSSIKVNKSNIPIKGKTYTLLDIPGHTYYQEAILEHLGSCKGVVLLVDSTDKPSFKRAAEILYEILGSGQPTNILVFCNKQDQQFAKKTLIIESDLSTEIERLRQTKHLDLTDEVKKIVGKEGERFDFSQIQEQGTNVQFGEGSLVGRQFDSVNKFIEKVLSN